MSKCGEKWPRDMRKNAVDQRLLPFRGVHLIERKTLSFSSSSEEREREREIDRLSCVSSQPSCLKRIYTLTCIIYLYYIIILFSFKMDKMRVSFHFCIFMM